MTGFVSHKIVVVVATEVIVSLIIEDASSFLVEGESYDDVIFVVIVRTEVIASLTAVNVGSASYC